MTPISFSGQVPHEPDNVAADRAGKGQRRPVGLGSPPPDVGDVGFLSCRGSSVRMEEQNATNSRAGKMSISKDMLQAIPQRIFMPRKSTAGRAPVVLF